MAEDCRTETPGAWRWGAAGGVGAWVALQRVHAVPPPRACPWARAVVPSLSVSTGPSDPPCHPCWPSPHRTAPTDTRGPTTASEVSLGALGAGDAPRS